MANRFHGSYRRIAAKSREHGPRGIRRMIQHQKRAEANARNELCLPERRRAFRRMT